MSKSTKIEKEAFAPDMHVPFHHVKYVQLFLKTARETDTHNVTIMGDFIDCHAVSDYPKKPTDGRFLKEEIDRANNVIDDFDKTFKKKKRMIFGNHEARVNKYIMKYAPALHGLVDLANLLHLKKRGWEVTPHKEFTKIGDTYFTHDVDKAGRNSHIDAYNHFHGPVYIGHIHTVNYAVEGDALGNHYGFGSFGWLGDPAQVDYMYKIKMSRFWAPGFGHGLLQNGKLFMQVCPIINDKVMVEGTIFRA